MVIWLVFCSILISLVCEALLREGYGAIFAAKVAGWSMLTALICTLIPDIIPELDGRGRMHVMNGDLSAWASNRGGYNWRPIRTYKIILAEHRQLQQDTPETSNNLERGIDFTPTCGTGDRRIENRLELSEISRRSEERRC